MRFVDHAMLYYVPVGLGVLDIWFSIPRWLYTFVWICFAVILAETLAMGVFYADATDWDRKATTAENKLRALKAEKEIQNL